MHVAAQLDHWPKWLGALKAFMADTYFIGVSKMMVLKNATR